MWYISVTILLGYFCSSVALYGIKVCRIQQLKDEYENLNISNPLDRQVNFLVTNNVECWVDTTSLCRVIGKTPTQKWSNATRTPTKNLTTAVKLLCSYKSAVHFIPFNSSKVTLEQKWDIVLILSCPVAVKEIHTFSNFGRIIMLHLSREVKIFEADDKCQYAQDLQTLVVEDSCESNELSSTKRLFWETCKHVFSKTIILSLKLCMKVNITALREKFPNIHILNLSNASIDGVLHFPWNNNYETETNDTEIMDISKLWLNFVIKPYPYIFPFSINALRLYQCKIKQSFLNFTGKVDEIRISGTVINYIQTDLFHNTMINFTLYLCDNNLQSLDEHLFQNQHLLKFLYLQGNKLAEIPRRTFWSLQSLLTIDLSRNFIRSLHGDVFRSLLRLKEINLSSNLLAVLPENIFRDQIHSLRSLHLFSNPLTDIPIWPLYSTSLEVYNMNNAQIDGESVVRLLQNLRQIDIAEKEIETLSNFEGQRGDPQLLLRLNQIKTIPSTNMTIRLFGKLATLLSHYTVLFNGNPLTCNCDTFIIRYLVKYASENEATYSLNTFTCTHPPELRGRHMWSITDEEMYCPVNMEKCPAKCKCFKRKINETVIVDCRDVSLGTIPTTLPLFKLELWFENSNITEITHVDYLNNVTVLNLARNHIKQISPSVINDLKNAQTIYLHSNNLTSIPIQIRSLHFSKLTVSDNPFICDCTLRWMKTWLLNAEHRIVDWVNIQCHASLSNVTQLIAVPDSHFICKQQNEFSTIEHVFLPSVITGTTLFVLISLSIIGYVFRFNIKVLLFIYFNLHPFDKKHAAEVNYSFYDAVLIYVAEDMALAKTIANYLQKKGYEIGDFYTNSFIGYTWIENIDKLLDCSKSVILCLPGNWENSKIIQAAWNIAYNKFVTSSSHSIILITEKRLRKTKILDDNLRLFMRSSNCVDRNARLLLEKINYLMPSKKSVRCNRTGQEDFHGNVEVNYDNDICGERKRVVISYPDELELHVKNKIMPFLSQHNLNVKVLDELFTPGQDKRDKLPVILDAAHFVIYILNEETLADEIKLYILTEIVTKAQPENHNYLILCTSGPINMDTMSKELSKYVENYVTLSTNDPDFQVRILESLTQKNIEN